MCSFTSLHFTSLHFTSVPFPYIPFHPPSITQLFFQTQPPPPAFASHLKFHFYSACVCPFCTVYLHRILVGSASVDGAAVLLFVALVFAARRCHLGLSKPAVRCYRKPSLDCSLPTCLGTLPLVFGCLRCLGRDMDFLSLFCLPLPIPN